MQRVVTRLAARYRDCLLGDAGGLLLLLAQAPLIGWLCAVVWGSIERDTPPLYFVLCLSAVSGASVRSSSGLGSSGEEPAGAGWFFDSLFDEEAEEEAAPQAAAD